MNKEFDYNVLDEILKEHNYDESHTVTILQEVQAHYSYLPKEAFPLSCGKLRRTRGKDLRRCNIL